MCRFKSCHPHQNKKDGLSVFFVLEHYYDGLEAVAVLNDSPGDCQNCGKALPAGKGVLAPNEVALRANGHAFGVIKVVKKLSKCSQILFKNVVQLFTTEPPQIFY